MAERSVLDDFELIIEDIGGGGKPPDNRDGGDSGDSGKQMPGGLYARKYAIAIALALVAVLMFFMAMIAAFLVLRMTSAKWVELSIPNLLWVNTLVLLASSGTLELARKRLNTFDEAGFRKLWTLTTILGVLFVAGQAIAWWELLSSGIHASTTLAAGFFYVFTVAHAAHLLGGICALFYVGVRKFGSSPMTRKAAAEVASYYWHFMDALWVFLLALLYFGK
ncbi:MAG: heme-copper oxidase subunit III [Acidobacteria bacterium]|nr:heme-copper oxidase subunit III [Acidobacteriota bacterium]MBS1867558.1 heme-copper oxidase subunit III [Acidobacteriota bacterium]